MPKTGPTRKQRAEELLTRLRRGPQISDVTRRDGLIDIERVKQGYRCWAESWVLTDLCQLVPELRGHLNTFGYFEGDDKEVKS